MAAACAFGSLSVINGRLASSSTRLDPSAKRAGAVSLITPTPVFQSIATQISSMGLSGMPLCSFSKWKNSFVGRNAAMVPRASAWEEEDNKYDRDSSASADLKIFVGNLPFDVDSAQLAQIFQDGFEVNTVEVIYDRQTGRSRGFGFVTMENLADVEAAVDKFNGYELNGRALRVNSGPPPPRDNFAARGGFRSERSGGDFDSANRLFVGNLPWGADDLSLEQLFSDHGKVVEARVVYDRETGRSRGFGFVTLSSSQEVNEAVSTLDGSDMDGRPLRVSVAEARSPRF
eukprot:Gb_29798 [translate_table: standard]